MTSLGQCDIVGITLSVSSPQKLSSERPSSDGEGVVENGVAVCNGKEQGEFCPKHCGPFREPRPRACLLGVRSRACHRPGRTDGSEKAPGEWDPLRLPSCGRRAQQGFALEAQQHSSRGLPREGIPREGLWVTGATCPPRAALAPSGPSPDEFSSSSFQ